jgi:hypothetical protein
MVVGSFAVKLVERGAACTRSVVVVDVIVVVVVVGFCVVITGRPAVGVAAPVSAVVCV